MNTDGFTAGLDAFKARDFDAAQRAWSPLLERGDDRVLTLLGEYRYASGDMEGARDLASRRSIAGTGIPSATVQFARATMFLNGAEDPVVVPVLTKAEADGDPDAAVWLAEALHLIGDAGASGRLWRKAAQQGSELGIRRVVEHLRSVDPGHPEIIGWEKVARDRGVKLDSGAGSAFGRELPESQLTLFIRGAVEELPSYSRR